VILEVIDHISLFGTIFCKIFARLSLFWVALPVESPFTENAEPNCFLCNNLGFAVPETREISHIWIATGFSLSSSKIKAEGWSGRHPGVAHPDRDSRSESPFKSRL
jgi:hypothetical protein